ncbi:class F sortase [Streptomyces lavendulocolor]|uniref:class F sortase n=1 Tax=Streptomyces lavendulocolor TaxID=67316 RepID=UPI0033F636D7
MDLPRYPKTAGWWKDSALPGSRRGTTVIAGHRDTRRGAAVFAALTRAKAGEPITVTTAGAGTIAYRIRAVTVRRSAALPAEFLSTTGPPRLVLIQPTHLTPLPRPVGSRKQGRADGGHHRRVHRGAAPALQATVGPGRRGRAHRRRSPAPWIPVTGPLVRCAGSWEPGGEVAETPLRLQIRQAA